MRLLNLNLDFRIIKRYRSYPLPVKTRLKILGEEVSRLKPEIITLQEITDTWAVFQIKKILGPLSYDHIYKGLVKVSGGVMTWYDYSQWNFIKSEFTAFAEQGKFFSKQLADRILRKGILTSILEDRESGQRLQVINLHLTANYGQKLKEEEREILKIQLKQLEKLIINYKNECSWQVIAGDFNADFTSKTIQVWLKKNNLVPAFNGQPCTVCPAQNPLCHRDQNKDYQIDNVLCSDCQNLTGKLEFSEKEKYLSDHYGQLVEIEF